MNELKARTARSIADEEEMLELGADCPIEPAQVYLKEDVDKLISELKSENKFVKERLEQQEKTFKWHKVEVLFGKLTGDLPSRDLNRVYGRDFLVHYTVIYGNSISHGIAYSDYDEEEGFFELEENYIPVHWCEVPLPPLAENFKEAK